ncbi:recombinase family protein [Mesorhizobium sp.]|uniref:recombinase family protein n=1 Tax=Mesorhizobium sp. TaxID=1871066 RepID=UPI0025BDCBD0|nr:recombinase family protein [Mesorhizobium sp.]
MIRSLRDRALTIPRRNRFGDVVWRVPTASMLAGMLKNPAYAGAFVYGRTQSCHARYASGKIISRRRPMAEWKIVVKDRYPAYLDWERYERIQTMLTDNHAEYRRNQTRGAPRDGAEVLQGIVWCGRCGHKMGVEYKNGNRYVCNFLARSQGGALCQHLPADPIDARVVEAFFAAASPAEREVEPRVHALSALSRGAEMEVRLLELAHQGLDDTAIAARLTKEGFRSPRRSYVPVRTVQVVRQGHRVLRQSTPARSHHIPGWLSVSELAMAAGRFSILDPASNPQWRDQYPPKRHSQRVLFPDAAATIAAIKELKSGVRQHLDFTQSATE